MVMAHNPDEQGLPCAFCILPNKKQSTYELMLNLIKEKVGPDSGPSTIVIDFELAMVNAVRAVFPDTKQLGCQFHFRSAIWKNVGLKHLQSFFYTNVDFQELIYKLYALAYIPTDDLYEVYKEQIVSIITRKLAEKTGDPEWQVLEEEINQFGTYFLNTWIGRQVCTLNM